MEKKRISNYIRSLHCRSRAAQWILAGGNGRFLVGPNQVPDHERDHKYHSQEGIPNSGHNTAVYQHGVEKFRGRRAGRDPRREIDKINSILYHYIAVAIRPCSQVRQIGGERNVPALTRYKTVQSAGVLDITNKKCGPWLQQQLKDLVEKYQFDAFYLDTGTVVLTAAAAIKRAYIDIDDYIDNTRPDFFLF